MLNTPHEHLVPGKGRIRNRAYDCNDVLEAVSSSLVGVICFRNAMSALRSAMRQLKVAK
jgi:hypothetical protein